MCGKESEHERITSSPGLGGYSDLDYRPRWAYMEYWTQKCPHCGYVNTSLAQPSELSMETLLDVYKKVETGFNWRKKFVNRELSDPDIFEIPFWMKQRHENTSRNSEKIEVFLEEVNLQFAKLGAMFAKLDKNISAARQFLRTAWCFDDEQNNEQAATHWRKVTIECIELAFRQLQLPISEATQCIYADMQRRVGNFEAVLALNENQLQDEVSIQLIKYQKELAKKGDSAAHKMSDNDDLLRAIKRKY
jgi:hypothetical protein